MPITTVFQKFVEKFLQFAKFCEFKKNRQIRIFVLRHPSSVRMVCGSSNCRIHKLAHRAPLIRQRKESQNGDSLIYARQIPNQFARCLRYQSAVFHADAVSITHWMDTPPSPLSTAPGRNNTYGGVRRKKYELQYQSRAT